MSVRGWLRREWKESERGESYVCAWVVGLAVRLTAVTTYMLEHERERCRCRQRHSVAVLFAEGFVEHSELRVDIVGTA